MKENNEKTEEYKEDFTLRDLARTIRVILFIGLILPVYLVVRLVFDAFTFLIKFLKQKL